MADPGDETEQEPARFAPGVSEAATPTPTPATVPQPPADVDPGQEPTARVEVHQYATPVDPWAVAEAAAIAAGGKPSFEAPPSTPGATWTVLGATEPTAEEPEPPRRTRRMVTAGIAGLLVAAVAVAATVYFWPRYPALDFHTVEQIKAITPRTPITSAFVDAEVLGDRAYFASADDQDELHVVAADTGRGDKALWEKSAGKAKLWESMAVTPSVVALFSGMDSTTGTKKIVVLDAADGDLLWEKPLDYYDEVLLGAETAVWSDRAGERLVGLGLTDGAEKWQDVDPDGTVVRPVLTAKDLAGPAGTAGRLFAPDLADDERIVQFDSDRTVKVRDIDSGNILQERTDVASTSEKTVAYDGRLFVLEVGTTKRIFEYDLANLAANPGTVHSAASTDDIDGLVPCGKLLCFIQKPGYDRKIAKVYAVGGEGTWNADAPNVDSLVAVGDRGVLANTDEDSTLFLDGEPAWTWPGVAVRLDAANVLRFASPLTGSVGDQSLSGVHLGDKPVELSLMRDVRSGTCAWNTAVLACATGEKYVVYSFAD
ncbi:hypothetical protein MB27_39090 [Actinoplanes utahensis]|uniref:Uncharacterized protein n=2 Tax=Actinoplanes utahensis TaxID=1869 RepID=A0A0A6UBM1_ACTUT|nr:hypothetical protein MB27_39090 [Actinoplanes utahensis]